MELCIAWYLKENKEPFECDDMTIYAVGRYFLWKYKDLDCQSTTNKQKFTKKDIEPIFRLMKEAGIVKDEKEMKELLNKLIGTIFWSEWRFGFDNFAKPEDLISKEKLKKMSFEEVLKIGMTDDIERKSHQH